MNFNLEKNNNSKKLVIGVSILFCAVILIIGGTTAFFTQSGIGDTGNIVTTNINGTIGYSDNNDYMRGNLIPVIESDAPLFAMKNSINPSGEYTNEDICTYKDDMYACSLYEFTITNNANVTQDMMVTLTPYPNGFGNLYYMIYESKQLELNTDRSVVKTATHIDDVDSSTMINSVVLKPGQSKTYTVVFYVKSMNYDQTSEDAKKRFGAIIRVDSTTATTKTSTSVVVGETCYDMTELDDGTYKLTKFNGIDENGNADTSCGVTKSDGDLYSINVPSKIGSYNISALGNELFSGIIMRQGSDEPIVNPYYLKINNVFIDEGITTIEDGGSDIDSGDITGTFKDKGIDINTGSSIENFSFNIQLPKSLKYIGVSSFEGIISDEIIIPENVEIIGDAAFRYDGLEQVKFEKKSKLHTIGNAAFDDNNISNLTIPNSVTTIGNYAFKNNDISTLTIPNSVTTIGYDAFRDNNISTLTIPNSVKTIGDGAFDGNSNLSTITFEEGSNLTTIGHSAFSGCNISTLTIPNSVKTIGDGAFSSNIKLTILMFEEGNNLTTIGQYAFSNCDLTYTDPQSPLVIPSSVTEIGRDAFWSSSLGTDEDPENRYLNYIKFNGILTAGNTDWYRLKDNSGATIEILK